MRFCTLFTLRIRHEYYGELPLKGASPASGGGPCSDFVVEPLPETGILLKNYRCLLKALPDGLRCVAAADSSNPKSPRFPMDSANPLQFGLRLLNPEFLRFTNVSELADTVNRGRTQPAPIPTFRSPTGTAASSSGLLTMDRSDDEKRPPIRVGKTQRYLAGIELRPEDWKGRIDAEFRLEFKSLKAIWRYYLISRRAEGQDSFVIDTATTGGASNPPEFKKSAPTNDSVGSGLRARFPDSAVYSLDSTTPVPCRQRSLNRLRVRHGQQVLQEPLPNPSLRNHFRVNNEDFLFHILNDGVVSLSPAHS